MIKADEISIPESCLSKARDDEMLFVLISRDEAAPDTIMDWCRRRVFLGKNKRDDPQIIEAIACAERMRHQRKKDRGY